MASALVGSLLIATLDALAKLLTVTMSTAEIMLYRSVLIAAALALLIVATGARRRFVSARPRLNLLRAVLSFAASTLIIMGFRYLPLADALALFFVNPLIVAVLSRPLLGEGVGARSWTAVAAGFGGALLIIQPGGEAFDWRALIPIGAALAGALQDIVTRRLQGHDHPQTVLLYTMVLAAIGGGVLAAGGGQVHWPTGAEGVLLVASAAAGFGAYYFFIQAYQLAPPARVAPLRYTTLVWAALYGFLIWGHVPDAMKAVGAAIVIGSGLFVFCAERVGVTSPSRRASTC
jgi:drug/metabolite transporter (DMT)-like permease